MADIDYIHADLWSAARKDFPCGRRGWFVIEGDKWATLFSPASLETVRLPIEEYDALEAELSPFDRARMIERLEANIALADRHRFKFSQSNAAKVLTFLKGEEMEPGFVAKSA